MKKILLFSLVTIACAGIAHAQYSRLHIKEQAGATYGLTAEASTNNKVIGFAHDGTWGIISTGTVNGAAATSPLQFRTSDLPRITILENGFVGIGTSAPTVELTVKGKILATEVKVNVGAGGGPDYVFAKDYTLLPLKEVALYINQHHHLPQVPAATEMESEGVNLSEMNMLLLKKVEELTLYLIEQNAKLEEVKNQLARQQKELDALKTGK